MSNELSLDSAELDTLSAVLDTLIPPDESRAMPGAGSLGLACGVVAEIASGTEILELVRAGVARVESRAGAATGFAALGLAAREQVLRADFAAEPGFVRMLLATTYILYYEHPTVIEALGLEARPPHPLGYPLEAGDLALLDPVRERSKLYRDA